MADSAKEYLTVHPPPSGRPACTLLLNALSFAARQHRDQRRKNVDTSPYINHPIAVAQILCSEASIDDVEILCAALLHDTIENTKTTPQMLEERFGAAIAEIVSEVTDDKRLSPLERKRRQVEHAPSLSGPTGLIKIADKIANLRDVAHDPPTKWSLKRRREYFGWAQQVADQLRGRHAALEQLFEAAYSRRP
jgi:guanosine-3',5'-bis(diphosphate) 3'-pyrophosphohydrolase